MIVMPGNDGGAWWGYLAGKYPGKIGSLFSPGRWKTPVPFAPYALDNGAFTGFCSDDFLALCERARRCSPPMWVAVPDSVGNRTKTLEMWGEWHPRLLEFRWNLAFVVQDGMTPDDVPDAASVVFVGGSTAWKWKTLRMWTANFLRVHVGRVNTERHLWQAHDAGAESYDGTGWFRNPSKELPSLIRYLDGIRDETLALFQS